VDINDDIPDTSDEIGSDELLSDDSLRLPESANILVRTHAVRAWLTRRCQQTTLEIGEAALVLQQAMMAQEPQGARLRRRERQSQEEQLHHIQKELTDAQQRLAAYEEAQTLLEDCIAHTSGERVLVEYYLALEDLVQSATAKGEANQYQQVPRLHALADVQHHVEHVGASGEEI